jgi:hypothetical protein
VSYKLGDCSEEKFSKFLLEENIEESTIQLISLLNTYFGFFNFPSSLIENLILSNILKMNKPIDTILGIIISLPNCLRVCYFSIFHNHHILIFLSYINISIIY